LENWKTWEDKDEASFRTTYFLLEPNRQPSTVNR